MSQSSPTQDTQHTSYLRYDMTVLVALFVIISAAMFGLWYVEQHGGWFSRAAAQLLDALSH